jgi:hypothetical protein
VFPSLVRDNRIRGSPAPSKEWARFVVVSPAAKKRPRPVVEQAYPNLIHYNKLPKGGHFAAWEQPKFLSDELRAGFKSLRK